MEQELATRVLSALRISILCAGLLAGCGGGGGGGSPAPAPSASAPTITTQPQSQTVTTGSSATFTVVASGTGLSYQWSRNGTPIPGATSASYSISAAALTDSGASFTVMVSNSGGQVTSNAAVLTANGNPEGFYVGTLTSNIAQTTQTLLAVVLKDGTFQIFVKERDFSPLVPKGFSLSGAKVSPAAGSFTTTYTGYTLPGYVFSNNQPTITGTLTGTIAPGVSITGTYTSGVDTGSFALTAAPDYNRAASTATIAGTYHYSYFPNATLINATITIDADGTATVVDSAACDGPVTYSVPDPLHNAYKVTNSAKCPGVTMPPFIGLAVFFPAGTGAALNDGENFPTDTLVAIADNGINGLMVIGVK
jgi:hypothetical protein